MLDVRRLRKGWRGGPLVLDGISLTVPAGALCVVEGANGAGKSTLVRIVAGLLEAEAGNVRVRGRDPAADRVAYQRDIGLAAAGNSGLYARLDTSGHLALAAGLSMLERPRRGPLIAAARERFGLAAFGARRVDRLSMGERQRLRLALAFLHEPGLVLLDEPLTSLDPAGRAVLESALADHLAAGRSALWVSPTGDTTGRRPDLRLTLASGRLSPS